MNEKKIEPTQAMVDIVELADKLMVMDTRDLLRTALNHPDAAGLFECDHTDYVHVDEAATRVEAAREQGWDDAAQHIYNKGWEGVTALRNANPYRPAQELPTEDGAVIVPADGHDFIEQVGDCANYRRLTYDAASGRWIGWDMLNHEAEALSPEYITPGTWKVEGK